MKQFINILLDRLDEKEKDIASLNSIVKVKDADIRYLKGKIERQDQDFFSRHCDYVNAANEKERLEKELVKYTKQCEALSAECQELREKLNKAAAAPKPKKVGNPNAVPPNMREEAPALQDAGFLFIKPDEPRMFSYYDDAKEAGRAMGEKYLSIKFAPTNRKLIGGLQVFRAKQRDELIDGQKVFDILNPRTGENDLRYYASDGHMDTILADA